MSDFYVLVFKVADEQIRKRMTPEMGNIHTPVYRGTACVYTNFLVPLGVKSFFFPTQGIIDGKMNILLYAEKLSGQIALA